MKKYLLLLVLLLIPSIAFAASPELIVRIQGNAITVKDGDTIINDYSSYFTYVDGVLTLNERTIIKNLEYDDVDLTITSNNKVAYIKDVHAPSNAQGHNTLKIINYNNDENTSYILNISNYSSVEVENSTIYNMSGISNFWNREAGVTVKNSKLYSARSSIIHCGGPILIDNSYIESNMIQSEYNSVIVKDSTIKLRGGLYSEGDYVHIFNSTIEDDPLNTSGTHGYIDTFRSAYSTDYSIPDIIIKDSKIDVLRISVISDNNLPIIFENSDIKVKNNLYLRQVNMINTKLKCLEYFSAKLLNAKDSIIDLNGEFNLEGSSNENLKTVIDNTTINYKNRFYSDMNFEINNSRIYGTGRMLLYKDSIFNNSYLKILDSDTKFDGDSLSATRKFKIHRTYVYIENLKGGLPFRASNIFEYDEGTVFIDKDNTTIYPLYVGSYIFFYDELMHEVTASVTMNYKTNIKFRIKDGTWADGTSDDIVITKNAWTELTADDIPTGMMGDGEGYWVVEPKVGDVITDDVEYVYVFKQVKGIEENPVTGVFTHTLILIGLLIISIIGYKKLNKMELFKKY